VEKSDEKAGGAENSVIRIPAGLDNVPIDLPDAQR
jgi:hypothetical protein